ncbi:MFS transporter [Streptomyces sp. NBC_01077]|uniref:MFS transporter n=1 Tax=Streptomyces sp. NBC_01077 TaxID=2903746 RepID=UPI0038660AA8|nr:MFS transporter [Streptomyces sp. NBC_01077]
MALLDDIIPPPGIVRTLCVSNFAKTAGHGVLMAVSVLFFTRTVGIPAEQVGLALSIGAALGMAASIPAGRLADVVGPRNTTVGFLMLLGVFVGAYAFVDSFAGLVVVTSLALMAESSTDAARGALIAGLIPQEDRVRAWSYMRAVSNLGVTLGAAAGAVALWFDNRPGYVGLLIAGGIMFLVAGGAYLTVPSVDPVPKESTGPKWVVLRDLPYAAVALLNSVLVMNVAILTVALPIWITTQTSAPKWLYSAILILNTIMVVVFQVRAGKGSEDVRGGARTLRRCGVLLAVCCALFALAADQPVWVAVVALLAGAVVHVIGEMLYSAGSWSLAFGLAPDDAQGQYQGMFGMSTQLGSMVTPALATLLIVRLGWPAWLVFAALLLGAGLAAPAVAAWAERTRRPAPETGAEAAVA